MAHKSTRRFCKQYIKQWQPNVGNDLDAVGQLPRLRAIMSRKDIWANKSKITYNFMDSDPRRTRLVEEAVARWRKYVGLVLKRVPDSQHADVRIRFLDGDGHWSYVGTYVLQVTQGPTMNLDDDADLDTAIHEWGHTLGLKHEHQHPNGPVWNEAQVIRDMSDYWPVHVIRHNVLNKHTWLDVMGDVYDTNSIMHYSFPGSWLNEEWRAKFPNGIQPEPGISDTDIRLIKTWYPPVSSANVLNLGSNNISITKAGDTAVCEFTPTSSGDFTFTTSGRADTVMVIEADGQKRVDDDSGYARNAKITMKLTEGVKASVLLRLYWKDETADFRLHISSQSSSL